MNKVEIRERFGEKKVVVTENGKVVLVLNYINDAQVKEVCRDFHAEFIGVNDGSISVKLSVDEQVTVKASLMTTKRMFQNVKDNLVKIRSCRIWSDSEVNEYNNATEEIVRLNSIISKLQYSSETLFNK